MRTTSCKRSLMMCCRILKRDRGQREDWGYHFETIVCRRNPGRLARASTLRLQNFIGKCERITFWNFLGTAGSKVLRMGMKYQVSRLISASDSSVAKIPWVRWLSRDCYPSRGWTFPVCHDVLVSKLSGVLSYSRLDLDEDANKQVILHY